jgi:hypothetical protein
MTQLKNKIDSSCWVVRMYWLKQTMITGCRDHDAFESPSGLVCNHQPTKKISYCDKNKSQAVSEMPSHSYILEALEWDACVPILDFNDNLTASILWP